ncbi:GIY-YIG nuclease family protein [Candidatus Microgenomates bacterium]|nr:GIY-YIG nuclease family protein [Candidatus Microgenomates bacterium]
MKELENYSVEKSHLKSLPENPGVYIFKDQAGEAIYIGKAKNLKNRLTSYFSLDLLPKTKLMVSEAKYFSYILVNSEMEALLLEANLVRHNLPKYNIQLRDDKSPLYIVITREEFPRVLTARKSNLKDIKSKHIYGPFISSLVVRKILSKLRKIFPYSTHKLGKFPCLYSQIGLCSPCPNQIIRLNDHKLKSIYFKNISNLSRTLSGKMLSVKKDLEKEMKKASINQDFELAGQIRNQIRYLDYISSPTIDINSYIENPSLLEDIRLKETDEIIKILKPYFKVDTLERIECFDVAHLSGSFPTASMVTFTNGEPDKRFYRHFKINKKFPSDTDRMKDVLIRRLKHLDDWGKPDLIVVDGGKPQVSVAMDVVRAQIPVVGIAKRFETLVIKDDDKFIEIRLKPPALFLFQRLRDEAHRFSRKLHHKQISKIFDKDNR